MTPMSIQDLFEEAWNHQEKYERLMWWNAIEKELSNMFKHRLWEKVKTIEIRK